MAAPGSRGRGRFGSRDRLIDEPKSHARRQRLNCSRSPAVMTKSMTEQDSSVTGLLNGTAGDHKKGRVAVHARREALRPALPDASVGADAADAAARAAGGQMPSPTGLMCPSLTPGGGTIA